MPNRSDHRPPMTTDQKFLVVLAIPLGATLPLVLAVYTLVPSA